MSGIPAWFERKFEFGFPANLYPNICVRLQGTPARLEEMLRGVSRDALKEKPAGKWSAQEHAGHLLDLEPLWLKRVKDFLTGKDRLSVTDLTNRQTDAANYNRQALGKILTDFRAARNALVQTAHKVEPAFYSRTIEHPRLKQPMRLVDHLYFVAEHDDHHLAKIRELTNL